MNTSHNGRTAVRAVVVALVALLGASLLTLSTPVAHAAPPEVTASQNPVVIELTAKEITLTWNLGFSSLLARLTVTEYGSPTPVLEELVGSPPGVGTVPLKVTLGKKYRVRLTDEFTKKLLGAELTIYTEKAPIAAIQPASCKVGCIKDVHVQAWALYAHMTITTNTPATFTVEVRVTKQNPDQTWTDGAVEFTSVTTVPMESWSTQIPGLDPESQYHYDVRARDAYGGEEVRINQWFKTPCCP